MNDREGPNAILQEKIRALVGAGCRIRVGPYVGDDIWHRGKFVVALPNGTQCGPYNTWEAIAFMTGADAVLHLQGIAPDYQ